MEAWDTGPGDASRFLPPDLSGGGARIGPENLPDAFVHGWLAIRALEGRASIRDVGLDDAGTNEAGRLDLEDPSAWGVSPVAG